MSEGMDLTTTATTYKYDDVGANTVSTETFHTQSALDLQGKARNVDVSLTRTKKFSRFCAKLRFRRGRMEIGLSVC